MSCASVGPRWLNRPVINALMSYPFDQLGCVRVTSVTPEKNKATISFLRKFGFKREGCVRKGYGNQHAILFGLLRNEWRASRFYIPPHLGNQGLGQENSYASASA